MLLKIEKKTSHGVLLFVICVLGWKSVIIQVMVFSKINITSHPFINKCVCVLWIYQTCFKITLPFSIYLTTWFQESLCWWLLSWVWQSFYATLWWPLPFCVKYISWNRRAAIVALFISVSSPWSTMALSTRPTRYLSKIFCYHSYRFPCNLVRWRYFTLYSTIMLKEYYFKKTNEKGLTPIYVNVYTDKDSTVLKSVIYRDILDFY